MWTTRSPGVSRSRRSRGTTRRRAFGRRTRTVPNSSRSVTNSSPSGPPPKPPLRLRPISAIAVGGRAEGGPRGRGRGGPEPIGDGDGVARLLEEFGEAWGLVAGQHDPRAILLPPRDRIAETTGSPERQHRLAPAEQVARAPATAGDRAVGRQLRLPAELEGARAD